MRPVVVHPWEPRRRRNPLLALYRWRYELALVGVVAALVYLGQVIHWAAPLALVLTGIVVVATWEPARRAVGTALGLSSSSTGCAAPSANCG